MLILELNETNHITLLVNGKRLGIVRLSNKPYQKNGIFHCRLGLDFPRQIDIVRSDAVQKSREAK